MPEHFIQISNLVKTYESAAGPNHVLRGIDLTLEKGDFVAIVGLSGSGKTTFLNMVTSVDKPTSGTVIVDGVDVTNTGEGKLTRWRGSNIGIVFQLFQLLPTLTILENVMMPMDFCNVHIPEERSGKAMALLDRFDVADQAHKTPDMLSGGQQQRVAIARALANDPPLIIGDEPTANLDRMSADVVFNTFQELREQGHTIIIVTPELDLVQNVPTVLTLQDGLITDSPLVAAVES